VPRKTVAVGDGWQAGLRIDIPVVGEVKERFDCKLQDIQAGAAGRVAIIGADGSYERPTSNRLRSKART